jgi:hypothetical protein
VRRALLAAAAVVTLIAATAGGCGDTGDKFTRDCKAKGGHVATSTKDGVSKKVCVPPTGGGWQ